MQSPGLVDRLLVADGLSDGCLVVWPRLGPRTFELDSSLLTFAQVLGSCDVVPGRVAAVCGKPGAPHVRGPSIALLGFAFGIAPHSGKKLLIDTQ
jgi:hypothetical protein